MDWSGANEVIIGLEGHGRENISETIDVSHTVGWFTNLYPVSLTSESKMTEGDIVKSTKEALRKIPNKGMGYGALAYMHTSEEVRESLTKLSFDVYIQLSGAVR